MTLKIEAGKFYRNREGERVGPMRYTPHPEWPWECDRTTLYRADGTEDFRGKESPRDLVAEWEPTFTAEQFWAAAAFVISRKQGGKNIVKTLASQLGIPEPKPAPLMVEQWAVVCKEAHGEGDGEWVSGQVVDTASTRQGTKVILSILDYPEKFIVIKLTGTEGEE